MPFLAPVGHGHPALSDHHSPLHGAVGMEATHMNECSNDRGPSGFRVLSRPVNSSAAGEAFYRGFGLGLAVGSVLVGLILWGGVL